jgi:hypothetical protein
MFQDKLEVTGKLTLEELVLRAMAEDSKPRMETTNHDRRHESQQTEVAHLGGKASPPRRTVEPINSVV